MVAAVFHVGGEMGTGSWKDFLRKSGIHLCLVLPLDLSTLDSICDSLSGAFRGISHCPPSGLYAHLCRLLALCLGHRDPYATACLVTESVSITCRHQLLTHLHRQLR